MPINSYDAFAEFDDDPAHRQSITLEEKKDDNGKEPKELANGTVEKKKLVPVKNPRTKKDPAVKNSFPGLFFNIDLKGNHTLIKSVMILKKWHICKENGNRMAFQRFLDNEEKLTKIMNRVMENYGIAANMSKECYDPHVIGFQLQKFLDNPTPNRFRIFLFKEFDKNNKEPYWKSNAKSYTTPIAIIYTEAEKTYQPVRNIGRLWHHKGNYCFSCEKDYTIAEHHRESCKNKCSLCQRVGTKYPCKSQGISIKCPDCKRIFTNKECHQKHLAVYKGKKFNVCHRIRLCEKCSAVYHKHNGHNCRKRKEKTIVGGEEGEQTVKRQRKIDEFGI